MVIKNRAATMRHVSRTHRIDLDWLFERFLLDPAISIRYVGTKEQIADFLTKGLFTSNSWNHLCKLAQVGNGTWKESTTNTAIGRKTKGKQDKAQAVGNDLRTSECDKQQLSAITVPSHHPSPLRPSSVAMSSSCQPAPQANFFLGTLLSSPDESSVACVSQSATTSQEMPTEWELNSLSLHPDGATTSEEHKFGFVKCNTPCLDIWPWAMGHKTGEKGQTSYSRKS